MGRKKVILTVIFALLPLLCIIPFIPRAMHAISFSLFIFFQALGYLALISLPLAFTFLIILLLLDSTGEG